MSHLRDLRDLPYVRAYLAHWVKYLTAYTIWWIKRAVKRYHLPLALIVIGLVGVVFHFAALPLVFGLRLPRTSGSAKSRHDQPKSLDHRMAV